MGNAVIWFGKKAKVLPKDGLAFQSGKAIVDAGALNPPVDGYNAPVGSIILSDFGLYQKTGPLNTDWQKVEGIGSYVTPGDLPLTAPTGTLAVTADPPNIYQYNGTRWIKETPQGTRFYYKDAVGVVINGIKYNQLVTNADTGSAQSDDQITIVGDGFGGYGAEVYVDQTPEFFGGYVTSELVPGITEMPEGRSVHDFYAKVSDGGASDTRVFADIYTITTAGVETFRYRITSSSITSLAYAMYEAQADILAFQQELSEQLLVKIGAYTNSLVPIQLTFGHSATLSSSITFPFEINSAQKKWVVYAEDTGLGYLPMISFPTRADFDAWVANNTIFDNAWIDNTYFDNIYGPNVLQANHNVFDLTNHHGWFVSVDVENPGEGNVFDGTSFYQVQGTIGIPPYTLVKVINRSGGQPLSKTQLINKPYCVYANQEDITYVTLRTPVGAFPLDDPGNSFAGIICLNGLPTQGDDGDYAAYPDPMPGLNVIPPNGKNVQIAANRALNANVYVLDGSFSIFNNLEIQFANLIRYTKGIPLTWRECPTVAASVAVDALGVPIQCNWAPLNGSWYLAAGSNEGSDDKVGWGNSPEPNSFGQYLRYTNNQAQQEYMSHVSNNAGRPAWDGGPVTNWGEIGGTLSNQTDLDTVLTNLQNGVNARVLKSGDTMTGNLTFGNASGAAIQMDIGSPNPAYSEGLVFYDHTKKALSIYNENAAVTHNLGRESLIYVFNNTGSLISNGTPVYSVGPYSDPEGTPMIDKARADDPALYETYLGLTTCDIPAGQYGEVCAWGDVGDVDTSAFNTGDMLYLSATVAGGMVTTAPAEPNVKIHIGCVKIKNAVSGKIYVNKERHNALAKQDKFNGIEDKSLFSLGYDASTRIFSVTASTGAGIWINGVRYPKSGVVSTAAHATTTGKWFFYYNSSAVLTVSSTVWNLETDVPVAIVYYKHNATPSLAKGIIFDERHPAQSGMPNAVHDYLHNVLGTQFYGGGSISGYTLNTPGSAALSFTVSQATLADEDLFMTAASMADGGPYMNLWVDSASGTWDWSLTGTTGVLDDGTNIVYNDTTTGTLVPVTSNSNWVNYWQIALPFYATIVGATQTARNPGYAIITGQNVYGTLAAAQAVSPSNLLYVSNLTSEGYVFAKMIYQRVSGSSPSNAQVNVDPTYYRGSLLSITSGSFVPTDHSTLSNRTAANSHPASAINTDVTNFNNILTSADDTVQKALDTLDDNAGRTTSTNFTGVTLTPTSRAYQRFRYTGGSAQTFTTFTLTSMVDASTVIIQGTSNTNTLTIPATATGISFQNGDIELTYGKMITYRYDSTFGGLVEQGRNG